LHIPKEGSILKRWLKVLAAWPAPYFSILLFGPQHDISGALAMNTVIVIVFLIVMMFSVMIPTVSIIIICRAGLVFFRPPETAR
jgi:hypothetical protein